MAEHCIVVRRGDLQRFDLLYKTFGERVPVIWDRRRHEHQPNTAPQNAESEADRRHSNPPSWVALGFVVIER